MMQFEWDRRKVASNALKHAVTFEEATTVFDDPDFITLLDEEHSIDEDRSITVGLFFNKPNADGGAY